MAVDVRAMACNYLRNGAVTVFVATGAGDDGVPLAVRAYVRGQSHRYFVRRNYDGRWLCSCEIEGGGCPHVAAVQLATGHDGPARKPQTGKRSK